MPHLLGPRRGVVIDLADAATPVDANLSAADAEHLIAFDEIYRGVCALLYNYVPRSGHPGGSISSGKIVAALLFDTMDYDLGDPDRLNADLISYAAGHKALGLYAMWALRNEVARIGAPELLPESDRHQLRLEDLLGFRRNPVTPTPLFASLGSKSLDGHPTPATPHIKLATGASGVGLASSIGLGFAAADYYGSTSPYVHIIEGEGGMTPGRVSEAMAAAGTASLGNTILHIDFNQASIDSNRVCRDGDRPGDYVQWDPGEFAALHDWNVILVPDGLDFPQVVAAQRLARSMPRRQPTAIVYHTVKGWRYGIEGKASHGAGHKLCSPEFYEAIAPLAKRAGRAMPTCASTGRDCGSGTDENTLEACFWDSLLIVREMLEKDKVLVAALADRLRAAKHRLDEAGRGPRAGAPRVSEIIRIATQSQENVPEGLQLAVGAQTTLRAELGKALNHLNLASNGAIPAGAADLLDSTSVSKVYDGFADGFFNWVSNVDSRRMSFGGICEDGMSGIAAGMASFGCHIPAIASYAAFAAPLGHIASRLHAIGCQTRMAAMGKPYVPFICVCGHAGLKTGEDGPTHADPQALQLLQENFPPGTMITLTPWDPCEVWPLLTAALARQPAIIAPFVTRPAETILDRDALGLAPASSATTGVYALRMPKGSCDGVVVLQGSGVAYAFVQGALPLLNKRGVDLAVYYVASAELFDQLSQGQREAIFPESHARVAMGITGFTLPTMYRWITSERGRCHTLHPFANGHYLGSGQAHRVLEEAGLDGASQFEAIMRYIDALRNERAGTAK